MKEKPVLCTFVGVDLAWSKRNPSGLTCLLFDGNRARLLATDCKTTDSEIISWIERHAQKTTWVGIDAPIIAPNPPKMARPVDRIVSSLFGRFHAGVYPGNRERCARPIRLCRASRGLENYSERSLNIFPDYPRDSPATTRLDWVTARGVCTNGTVGGRRGWRLPSVHELMSLVDPSVASPGLRLPAGHPFTNVQPISIYWSATTSALNTSDAWIVDFRSGTASDVAGKSVNNFFIWCVRGDECGCILMIR